jgi:Protein of unknown function (DUF2800)
MSDRRHFRASQVPQAMLCAGSTKLIARIKDNRGSAAATLGNWCHWQAALTLIEKHGAIGPEGGLVVPNLPATFKPSSFGKWMAEYFVQTVLNYADADMAILVEQAFEHAFPRFDLTGHIDAFAINGDGTEAIGGDLKSGPEIVDEAEQNAQVLTYIVLLKLAYPDLRKITFFICQPSNDPDEGIERVTVATAEGAQIDGMVRHLERELNYAIDHENEINSDHWKACRYCPVGQTGQCPALNADLDTMKLTLTPDIIETIQAEPSIEQLAALELHRKKFTPIFDAAHEALKERIEAGGRVTANGYAFWLEEGNGRTKITDNAAATDRLKDLPDETFHTLYEFKKEPIEKALATAEATRSGRKVPHKSDVQGKTSGQSLFRETFAGITEQTKIKKLKMVEDVG